MTTNTREPEVNVLHGEFETNLLKRRDSETIDTIESSFKTGILGQAMKRSPEIERRFKLTPAEFVEEYRKQLKPVVMGGLLDEWPALKTWNWQRLVSKCGNAPVVVDSYNSARTRQVTFADFVDMLIANQGLHQVPLYLQEWLYMASCPQLAEDLPELPIAQYDFRRNLFGDRISTNHQLWIGQKGATTRIHQDSYFIDVMHAQIVGEKHWCVMSPQASLGHDELGNFDFDALVNDPEVQIMHCVLKPGDVLYLPAQWWHRIELLSDSIGQGRKCLDEVNLQKYIHMRFAELLVLALNRDFAKEAYPELYDVVVLRNQAWAKLLNIDLRKLRP
jgi:hypothetical protein